MSRIEYYVVPNNRVARNTGIFVTRDRWPLESLASRNWIGHRYYYRLPTQEEKEFAELSKRHMFIRYTTLEDLIEDEIRCVGEEEAKHIEAALQQICEQHGYLRHHGLR